MEEEKTKLLPIDLDVKIEKALILSRLVREKTDEVLRDVAWLDTSLSILFSDGQRVASRTVIHKIRTLNHRVYEITGDFPFRPLSGIFPVETPSPYLSDVSDDESTVTLWPKGIRTTL
jgi:hypothetical protein